MLTLLHDLESATEAYDAYDGHLPYAMISVKDGRVTAVQLNIGSIVYDAEINGTDIFLNDAERDEHLHKACNALLGRDPDIEWENFEIKDAL